MRRRGLEGTSDHILADCETVTLCRSRGSPPSNVTLLFSRPSKPILRHTFLSSSLPVHSESPDEKHAWDPSSLTDIETYGGENTLATMRESPGALIDMVCVCGDGGEGRWRP